MGSIIKAYSTESAGVMPLLTLLTDYVCRADVHSKASWTVYASYNLLPPQRQLKKLKPD